MGPSPYIDPLVAEKELTEEEMLLRRAFVHKFMEHRNAVMACIELGFMEVYAVDWARQFMGEGVVRRLISEAEIAEETPEGTARYRKRLKALMHREATDRGPGSSHSSRVTAIAHLMKIEGMEAPTKTETEVTHKGGVMMVPGLTSPEEWGEFASASQLRLKEEVKH